MLMDKTRWIIKWAITLNSSCDKIQPIIRSYRNDTFYMRRIKSTKEKTNKQRNEPNPTSCTKSMKKRRP